MVNETLDFKNILPSGFRDRLVNDGYADTLEETEDYEYEDNIIQTKYWTLPESSLNDWHPFTAFIPAGLFLGPSLKGYGRGLSLHKDLMGGIHGARGSGKDEVMSFLLAKKMRSGKPVWTNYPISFFVIEEDGSLTYYESRPLDLEKFYAFSPLVRNGAVGITELQYYVEARTSGRAQNRIASYQIMQLRKTALSFLYNVQDRKWVDKRFGWSNDFDIECADIAKLPYNRNSVSGFPSKVFDEHGMLREGAYVRFFLEDTSGVLTGKPYVKNHKDWGPFQFAAHHFWNIYPTNFIIDAYEAMNSYKKKNEKQEQRDFLANTLESAIEYFLQEGNYQVVNSDLWAKADEIAGQKLDRGLCGRQLSEWGISKKQEGGRENRGKYSYNIGVLLEE